MSSKCLSPGSWEKTYIFNIYFNFVILFSACSFRLREVGMPADYVNKLARMFQDVKVSEDLNQQFKEQCRSTRGSIAGTYNFV